MTVLVGASAFFIGNAYQAQMPGFALDFGLGRPDFTYSILLAADAAGGLAAGLILESGGLLPPKVRTAYFLAMIWCCALAGFARSNSYALAITLLFIAGFVELSFNSMAQSLVQLKRAGRDSRPGDRRLRDVCERHAHLQRAQRRAARCQYRHPQFFELQCATLLLLYLVIFGARQVARRRSAVSPP